MKIIGHRGAAGLALENTVESIHAAIKAGVDAIEFDIRVTKDNKIVLSHDSHTGRVSKHRRHIGKHSLAKLKAFPLYNGQAIATLAEAMNAAGKIPLVIEGKESGWAKQLSAFLNKSGKNKDITVISFNHDELEEFHKLMPKVPVYALEHTNPFEVIRTARTHGFTGININFWILNPFTYLAARWSKLEIIVYTVNKPWLVGFLKFLYPRISITTNFPDQLQHVRKKRRIKK